MARPDLGAGYSSIIAPWELERQFPCLLTLYCVLESAHLLGLYKSRPTGFGVAHVGICAVSNSFTQGSSTASIFVIF